MYFPMVVHRNMNVSSIVAQIDLLVSQLLTCYSCAIESELDRGYQFVRRRKAGGLRRRGSAVDNANDKERRERDRANSAGAR